MRWRQCIGEIAIFQFSIGNEPAARCRQPSCESTAAGAGKSDVGEGYDPQFGARPLKRAVQERILNPLSMRLLEGDLSRLGNGERNLSRIARDEGR
jgi:hypothetical protein